MSSKKKPENRQPATVEVYGLTIPVHDYLTAWELERIELLAAEKPQSATRHDLEVLAVFIESRLGGRPDLDKLQKLPIRSDELTKAVEVLLGPFYDWQVERLRRRYEKAKALLTPQQREERIAALVKELDELRSAGDKPN